MGGRRRAEEGGDDQEDADEEAEEGSKRRIKWLVSLCLVSLMGSLACLAPHLSLHLTRHLGLRLFESELVEARASLLSALLVPLILLPLLASLTWISRFRPQSSVGWAGTRWLLALGALASAALYLALVVAVGPVRQSERMPLATFDCNANLITIENCRQQFVARAPEQTLQEALGLLWPQFTGEDQSGDVGRQLNCLKYNDKQATRFLLHHCALVCRPQRQQLHQFGDDLNQPIHLSPPYSHNFSQSLKSTERNEVERQVSLRVCFSSNEFASSPQSSSFSSNNNYKQFCITNLASGDHQTTTTTTMSVGQLNALLRGARRVAPAGDYATQQPAPSDQHKEQQQQLDGQTSHYVNPVVQFESHFKNWPHLQQRTSLLNRDGDTIAIDHSPPNNNNNDAGDQAEAWCRFKPMPPFIVNNRPFSDIQCSLEQEYTISSNDGGQNEPTSGSPPASDGNKIYLRKSQASNPNQAPPQQERCNIQCKLNILYQQQQPHNVYLPLRPCLKVAPGSDKARTLANYLWLRSLADTSQLLVLLLLDLLLLHECQHVQEAPLESKRHRLVGLLLALLLAPLLLGLLSDLIIVANYQHQHQADKELTDLIRAPLSRRLLDIRTLPVLLHAGLMFTLAIGALRLPASIKTSRPSQLTRVSSAEELGLAGAKEGKPRNDKELEANRWRPVISFALVALFLGLQFHLGRLGQTQLLLELFATTFEQQTNATSLLRALTTQSAGPLALLLLLLLPFHREASNFFSLFHPFGGLKKRPDNRRLHHLAGALLLHSCRSYALASLQVATGGGGRLTWVVAFMLQASELLSLPLIWLSLTARLHQLPPANLLSNALGAHLAAQSALAYLFFVLGRSLAHLLQVLNASLHLHSENVDWFIQAFHHKQPPSISDTNSSDTSSTGALFTPLPSERHTYLHALRLLHRNNSLLCLLLALLLLSLALHSRYQAWTGSRSRRQSASSPLPAKKMLADGLNSGGGSSSNIDERLSLDLMRLHSAANPTRLIPPPPKMSPKNPKEATSQDPPRAKILFHYQLDRPPTSTSSPNSTSAKDTPSVEGAKTAAAAAPTTPPPAHPARPASRQSAEEQKEGGYSERLVSHRHRRVRIFEDHEDLWPSSEMRPEEEQRQERKWRNKDAGQTKAAPQQKRSISFAPTATFIGGSASSSASSSDAASSRNQRASSGSSSTATRASPEPSIGSSSDEEDDDNSTSGSYALNQRRSDLN